MHHRQFHAAQRRADHGGRKDRDWFILPCLVERRHSRFRFSSARTGTTPDRRASAGAVFQETPGAPHIEDRASQNLRQRLDRNERRDFERCYYRRKLGCSGGLGGYQKRRSEYDRRRESCGRRENVSVMIRTNAQRSTLNTQHSMEKLGCWALGLGRWKFFLRLNASASWWWDSWDRC